MYVVLSISMFLKLCFYISGTVDNLTATSSPIQCILKDPRPGDHDDVIRQNGKAFREVCGPILTHQLGDREYMFGDSFTAIDVAVGFAIVTALEKRAHFLVGFPSLKEYAERLRGRPAYLKAIAQC